MGRWLKRIGIALGVLVGLLALAAVVVYAGSERVLQRRHTVQASGIVVPRDAASIDEGRRLATVRGCMHGCHGPQGEGVRFFDDPIMARLNAPNLAAAARRYSDGELDAIIRHGVRPDGTSVILMPSPTFDAMTDEDVGRIIAFLRSLPQSAGPGPLFEPGPIARLGLATGKFKTAAAYAAEDGEPPAAASEAGRHGRYLARTICTECHGDDLGGDSNPDFASPNLAIVAAYSAEDFTRLMRTGVATGNRPLGLMRTRAVNGFSQLTDEEIASLYEYLRSLATQ